MSLRFLPHFPAIHVLTGPAISYSTILTWALMLLLQALIGILLPLMVGTAIVMVLRHDPPEFIVQSPLSLGFMMGPDIAWMSNGHLEEECKGSTPAKLGVPVRFRYKSGAGRKAERRQEGCEKERLMAGICHSHH